MQRRPAISTDKCPSNSRRNPQTPKVLTFFTHDLTISYLAQAAGLEPTTHGFGDRCSTHIELRLCMPLLEKEPFLFFAEFLEDHCVEARKMVFFIFAGVGGTNPPPHRTCHIPLRCTLPHSNTPYGISRAGKDLIQTVNYI